MTVRNPNYGGHRRADDGSNDAPQHYEPWHYRSSTSSRQLVDLSAFGVPLLGVPSFAGTMGALLTSQGYTVLPPTPSLSSPQPRSLIPTMDPEEELDVRDSLLTQLRSELEVEEHLTEDGPQPDTALPGEVQASATEASNGDTSKNKNKSKKKKAGKQKQKQKICPLFQESGQCRYGDNCKFSHLLPDTLPDTLPSPDDTVNPDPPKKEEDSPIDLFFSKYPEFDYVRDKPLWNEFDRMGQHFKWQGPKRDQVKNDFRDALVDEFNYVYGTDESSLEGWGKLCQAMGLSAPKTLKEAHKIVRGAFVNLVVLVQSPRTCKPVEVFKSQEDLKKFTTETKWTFPQQPTQAGGLLKTLLHKMGGPSHGQRARAKKKVVAK